MAGERGGRVDPEEIAQAVAADLQIAAVFVVQHDGAVALAADRAMLADRLGGAVLDGDRLARGDEDQHTGFGGVVERGDNGPASQLQRLAGRHDVGVVDQQGNAIGIAQDAAIDIAGLLGAGADHGVAEGADALLGGATVELLDVAVEDGEAGGQDAGEVDGGHFVSPAAIGRGGVMGHWPHMVNHLNAGNLKII